MSCSGEKRAKEQKIQDSTNMTESITNFDQETIKEDSIREDSLLNVQVEEQFKNALTMTKGKQSKKWIGDATDPNISVPVNIQNNTDIPIKGSDYSIDYTYGYTAGVDEDGDGMDDNIEAFDKKTKKKGVDIAPRSSETIVIHEKDVTDISNIKLKFTLTKEEFEKRFRSQKM